jgi:hypothetical protein
MLVIISDLHLTDGTSGESLPPGAFLIFAERLRELAESASWRADGSYRPLERIDLVLLGDVLDVIRSAHWQDNDEVRPWSDPYSPEVVERATRITHQILEHNAAALQVLRGLARHGAIRIPPATQRGQPAYDTERQPVLVRIHYMVGNHDWFFHVRGGGYDALRRTIVEHLGLANRSDIGFPHDPVESGDLLDTMRAHRVLARHGDLYDPLNFEGKRDASSLGDAIIVELLNRFTSDVQAQLGNELPEATLAGFRELDNIRPLLLIPVWIDGLLQRSCPFPAVRTEVKKVWDRLAGRFLDLPFVRQRDSWHPADLVDGLEQALMFSQRLSLGWASRVLSWLHQLRGCTDESYYQHALAEQDFRNRRAMHIVYGHTHYVESVPLDASYADGRVLNQMYFNAGTWRRVHVQTRLAPGEHEFISQDEMTYLAFFRGDERKGRPFEKWSGTLGLPSHTATTYRIDAAPAAPVAAPAPHVHAPAPTVRPRAPHFSLSPAQPGIVPTRRSG